MLLKVLIIHSLFVKDDPLILMSSVVSKSQSFLRNENPVAAIVRDQIASKAKLLQSSKKAHSQYYLA